jgi:hypothetical protein
VNQPELAKLLPVLYPGAFPNLAAYKKDRADLHAILLTGIPGDVVPGFQNFTGPKPADMLRLNVAIPATPAASANPIGLVAGDRPLVDLLVRALGVAPLLADLDLHAVQLPAGVKDEGPDARPEVEHHVLGPSVGGVVVRTGHDEGVSYPSCGVPRYGNVAW